MISKKRKILAIILALAIIALFVNDIYRRNVADKRIEKFGHYTTAKIYKFSSHKSFQYYYYYFYYNGKKIKGSKEIDNQGGSSMVGRFFTVKFLHENPMKSKIYIDREIIDTAEIINADFKIEINNSMKELK